MRAWPGLPIAGVAVDFQTYHPPSDRWIAIAAHPVPDGVAIFASDVSADRRREAELEAARARLDAIINSTPDLVLAVDRNLRFLAFDRVYAEILERTFGRTISVGESFRDALADHPEAMSEAIARWERAVVHGEEFTTQRELGADGKAPPCV